MQPRLLALLALSLLLAAAPSALAQKNGDEVSIGKYHTIASKVLGEERTVLIHLPEGYETSTDKYREERSPRPAQTSRHRARDAVTVRQGLRRRP